MMWQVNRRAKRDLPDWMLARMVRSLVSGSAAMRNASAIHGVRSDRNGPGIGESGMACTLSSSQSTMSPESEGLSTSRPMRIRSLLFIDGGEFGLHAAHPSLEHLHGLGRVLGVAPFGHIQR